MSNENTAAGQIAHARGCLAWARKAEVEAKSKVVRRDAREAIEFWSNKLAMLTLTTGWSS